MALVVFDIPGDEPVPVVAFDWFKLEKDTDCWRFTGHLLGQTVTGLSIQTLTIHDVVAAMSAAARAAFARATIDVPTHDYKMTVSKGEH